MLRAYSGMPAEEFIAQLRTYVIAMGLGPAVADCVDNLVGMDADDDARALAITEAEEQAEKRGRKSMKEEMITEVTRLLEELPDASHDETLALLEKIEI